MALVTLRPVVDDDIPIFFAQQQDPASRALAVFSGRDPDDRAAFDERWVKIRQDPANVNRTVMHEGAVAGYVCTFPRDAHREIAYWLGEDLRGRGLGTAAINAFLIEEDVRGIRACLAETNVPSRRVVGSRWAFEFPHQIADS